MLKVERGHHVRLVNLLWFACFFLTSRDVMDLILHAAILACSADKLSHHQISVSVTRQPAYNCSYNSL